MWRLKETLACLLILVTMQTVTGCNYFGVTIWPKIMYTMSSVNYPRPYPGYTHVCKLTGSAPPGYKVITDCDRFNILNSENCVRAGLVFSPTGDFNFGDGKVSCGFTPSLNFQSTGRNFAFMFYNYHPNFYYKTGYHCYLKAVVDEPRKTSSSTSTSTQSSTSSSISSSTPSFTTTSTQSSTSSSTLSSTSTFTQSSTSSSTSTLSSNNCKCGQKNQVSRIVGGTVASVNEYPSLVGLELTNERLFCGGTLIADRWVLTAAHCLEPFKKSQVIVHLGEHDSSTSQETQSIRITSKRFIIHSQYNNINNDNDIALIELATPAPLTKQISPACLPFNHPTTDFDGETATVVGWGHISYQGEASTVVLEATLDIVGTYSCNNSYPITAGKITENMFCTHTPNKDACQGDSGGPLFYETEGRFEVIGIVSWGINCAVLNNPGVYAKVNNFLDWIQQKTGASFCQPQ